MLLTHRTKGLSCIAYAAWVSIRLSQEGCNGRIDWSITTVHMLLNPPILFSQVLVNLLSVRLLGLIQLELDFT